nr:MAG TPA: hypothetical protein [Caudoviricetes sp.]
MIWITLIFAIFQTLIESIIFIISLCLLVTFILMVLALFLIRD